MESYYKDDGFEPLEEMNIYPNTWCSAECFLAYARNCKDHRMYTLLEAGVCTLENRDVKARPSRFLMEKNGGYISTEDYLADRPVDYDTKRACTTPEITGYNFMQ